MSKEEQKQEKQKFKIRFVFPKHKCVEVAIQRQNNDNIEHSCLVFHYLRLSMSHWLTVRCIYVCATEQPRSRLALASLRALSRSRSLECMAERFRTRCLFHALANYQTLPLPQRQLTHGHTNTCAAPWASCWLQFWVAVKKEMLVGVS